MRVLLGCCPFVALLFRVLAMPTCTPLMRVNIGWTHSSADVAVVNQRSMSMHYTTSNHTQIREGDVG